MGSKHIDDSMTQYEISGLMPTARWAREITAGVHFLANFPSRVEAQPQTERLERQDSPGKNKRNDRAGLSG